MELLVFLLKLRAHLLLFEDLLLELLGSLALRLVDRLLLLELDVERVLENEAVELGYLLVESVILYFLLLELLFELLALVELRETLLLELVDRDLDEPDVRSKALRVVPRLKLLFLVVSAENDELLEPELDLFDLWDVHSAELVLGQMLLKLFDLFL